MLKLYCHVLQLPYVSQMPQNALCLRKLYPASDRLLTLPYFTIYKLYRSDNSIPTLRALYFPGPKLYKHQVARSKIPSDTTFFDSLRLRVPDPQPWQHLVSLLALVPPMGPTQLPPLKPTSTRVLASSLITLREFVSSYPSRPNSSPRLPPKSPSLSR